MDHENLENKKTAQLGIGEVSTSVSVPAVRVRFYPIDTDARFCSLLKNN